MLKKVWKISSLKYIAAFLIPMVFVLVTMWSLDNDSWGVLAEGKYIVNNGIYHTDVLSMHEGLNTVLQNYVFAVFFYRIYEAFGGPGLYIAMLILNLLVCILIYKICKLISDNNKNLSLIIMMITDVMLILCGFVTTRAQMVSFVLFLSLIYVLELYMKTGKMKYLWWIPLISLAQINLHASLWPMIYLVGLTYIVDLFVESKFLHKKVSKIWPLIVVGGISFLLGFANPYGVDMLTMMFKVYGDSTFSKLVVELQPFRPFMNLGNVLFYIVLTAVGFLYAFSDRKNVRIRYLLLSFGFLALGLNTIKGLSQVILVMFFPLALLYKDIRPEKTIESSIGRNALVLWSGILVSTVFVCVCPVVVMNVSSDYSDNALIEAVDVIDEMEGENDKRELNIYTGYNIGGYVEFRGYRPYMDPRGCDFMKAINGKEDILQEWVDFRSNKISRSELLDKYSFDYLLIEGENDPFYSSTNDGYEIIYKNEEKKIELYHKE